MKPILIRITLITLLMTIFISHQSQAATEIKRDGRFIAYDDGTVLDTKTNLMWAAKDNGANINWYDAKKYCDFFIRGGYKDWRMPTQEELAGLYDANKSQNVACDKDNKYPIHVATELISITCYAPWASENRGSGRRSEAATLEFENGGRVWYPQALDALGRALPVRSAR